MRAHMEGLVGRPLRTPVTGATNVILGLEGTRARVATDANTDGALVSISLVQGTVDRIWDGEEVIFNPHNRSAFLGAVLATMPQVEVLTDPRRARMRAGATVGQSPAWEPDELILALDLYLRWRPKQPPSGHDDLAALSNLLRRLPIHSPALLPDDFRSVGSVRRKLGDYKAADPEYTGQPTKGGAGVHAVWTEYADAPDALAAAVAVITSAADAEAPPLPPEDDEVGVVEGRLVYREHRFRERNPAVVAAKKNTTLKTTGRLACEVCDMDFAEQYGEIGEGYIEAHHTVQLALGAVRVTTIHDLALVCPNCHRMIHRGRPMLTIEQLRACLRN